MPSPNYNFPIAYTQPNILYEFDNESDSGNASEHDNTTSFYYAQPQFTRMRHRFRGPRESYKFNLELGQLRFDIIRLIEKYYLLQTANAINSSNLYSGALFSGIQFFDSELATPSTGDVLLEGIDTLSARLTNIELRLNSLEQ